MKQNIWLDGIMGVIIGDALGLPVQFLSREELKENPLKDMIGYGTFCMPEGGWSDDGSMSLATLDSNCSYSQSFASKNSIWNIFLFSTGNLK